MDFTFVTFRPDIFCQMCGPAVFTSTGAL
jgi:hypothetical protein